MLQRELHRQAQSCAAVLCVLKYLNPEPLAAALPCRPARRVAHEGLLYPQGATVRARGSGLDLVLRQMPGVRGAELTALVLEESVDEDGRRERRIANLDSAEDARAVAEQHEAAALEHELWETNRSQAGASRPRGLGGGAEWPRMPGMPAMAQSSGPPSGPRRSPRRRTNSQLQQRQPRAQPVDLFGDALQRSAGVLRTKHGGSAPPAARLQAAHGAAQKRQRSPRSSRDAAKRKERKEKEEREDTEEELDDVDARKLKRILSDQLRLERTDLRTLTPAKLRRKCASAMAFAPDSLEGPRTITLIDQWIKEELLTDPAGYLRRAGK